MALPYFREFGWQPFVLTLRTEVRPAAALSQYDPMLALSIPEETEISSVGAWPVPQLKSLGAARLDLRCLPTLYRQGRKIIEQHKIDLVFFSTTMFPSMTLGRKWHREYGVPYILDFQDPWLSDYYREHPASRPPGGRIKYGFSQFLARRMEPYAMKQAAHIVSVSPEYPKILQRRYKWLKDEQFTILPFGAPERDWAQLARLAVKAPFERTAGQKNWVYVGRGGDDMGFAVRAFFQALRDVHQQDPQCLAGLRIHFIGTDYSGVTARKTIEPAAVELGVAAFVREEPRRIPYFEALKCLQEADALLVFGSDDPTYTASKIYPLVLAGKPLLAVFHENSSVVEILRSTQSGTVVTFNKSQSRAEIAAQIQAVWFDSTTPPAPTTDWQAFEAYTARAMTRRLCQVFAAVNEQETPAV